MQQTYTSAVIVVYGRKRLDHDGGGYVQDKATSKGLNDELRTERSDARISIDEVVNFGIKQTFSVQIKEKIRGKSESLKLFIRSTKRQLPSGPLRHAACLVRLWDTCTPSFERRHLGPIFGSVKRHEILKWIPGRESPSPVRLEHLDAPQVEQATVTLRSSRPSPAGGEALPDQRMPQDLAKRHERGEDQRGISSEKTALPRSPVGDSI